MQKTFLILFLVSCRFPVQNGGYLNLDISVLYMNLRKSVKFSDDYVKIFRYDLNCKRLSLNNGMMIYNQTDYYSKNS